MSRKLLGAMIIAVLVFGVAALYAIAAETGAREAKEPKAAEKAETKAAEKGETKAEKTAEMKAEKPAEKAAERPAESEGMAMRGKQMHGARFGMYEPIGLLSLKGELKLTDEQVKKIEGINMKACEDAKAVLTKEQTAEVDKMKDTPNCMADMRSAMREHRGMTEGTPAEEKTETKKVEAKEKAAEPKK